jgi:hypothetical protein
MRRLRFVPRKHGPRDASGNRPLQLRGAAFNGWTGQGEGNESFPIGTRRAIRPCAGSTVPRCEIAAAKRREACAPPYSWSARQAGGQRGNARTKPARRGWFSAPLGASLPLHWRDGKRDRRPRAVNLGERCPTPKFEQREMKFDESLRATDLFYPPPCGEGGEHAEYNVASDPRFSNACEAGWGSELEMMSITTTTPTPRTSLSLRCATLPTRGRVRSALGIFLRSCRDLNFCRQGENVGLPRGKALWSRG